jgi:hypothetical protein
MKGRPSIDLPWAVLIEVYHDLNPARLWAPGQFRVVRLWPVIGGGQEWEK